VVFIAGEQIFRVRITSGTDSLSAINNDDPSSGVDIVVLDDFLYSEPLQAVPEPATWALFGVGAMGLVAVQRYRRVRKV
jgi:hypothetical protein